MSTLIEEAFERMRPHMPLVVLTFCKKCIAFDTPTPEELNQAWNDALEECNTIAIIEHQASTGTLFHEEWLAVLRHAGLLK